RGAESHVNGIKESDELRAIRYLLLQHDDDGVVLIGWPRGHADHAVLRFRVPFDPKAVPIAHRNAQKFRRATNEMVDILARFPFVEPPLHTGTGIALVALRPFEVPS